MRLFFRAVSGFFAFLLLIGFVISCCMLLFLTTLQDTMNIRLGEAEVRRAAVITFWNVILLSFLCAVIDAIRRRIMIGRPVKRIADATERIMRGDFTVRIDKIRGLDPDDGFNAIIDRLNKMTEELSGLETLRTDFIANVSHELKTPLAVIRNYAALLREDDLSEEKRLELAANISESARRLSDLVTNILKLDKLENQQIFPERRVFDLGEQLRGCFLGFERVWEEKEIAVDPAIEEDVLVASDPELLSYVWNNLFSNAFKFTEPGGRVGLTLTTEGAFAVVRVSDTGCGIDRETGARIFEKFYQGDPSRAARGNGLGLALVKRVADITGCDISVESEVGRGSTFTVKLRKGYGDEES
ncbi:MAG: HAMP domain-containing histidine kinase [Bacteroides sp.]|nr:HAMP domain-containing histidine kinase [Eubacterium sp.]MCM1419199.1 HAMP domain-containing histidine kinase [Roseburia sp.]MCM1463034.1 HAMP domain-containing histidine kinase [Bacteroides sp.]